MKAKLRAIFMVVAMMMFFAASLNAVANITIDSVIMGVGETSVSVFVGCSEPAYVAAMDVFDENKDVWIAGWIGFDLPANFDFKIEGLKSGTPYNYYLGVMGSDGSYDSREGFFTTIQVVETPKLSLSLSSDTPAPAILPPGTYMVTAIDCQNNSEIAGKFTKATIYRHGSVADIDVPWVYLYLNGQNLGYGNFINGAAEIVFNPEPQPEPGPVPAPNKSESSSANEIKPGFNKIEIAAYVSEDAANGFNFSLGFDGPGDIGADGFQIEGLFPIHGNAFTINNPPRPSLEAWTDRYDYSQGDRIHLFAKVKNPLDNPIAAVLWISLFDQNGNEKKLDQKTYFIPAKGQIERQVLILPSKKMNPGYYNFEVALTDRKGNVLDMYWVGFSIR